MSLPHYRRSAFLEKAVTRYKKFLKLKHDFPNRFLVPCYDFDLIWHAHQAHAANYIKYTEKYLGKVLPHDDSVSLDCALFCRNWTKDEDDGHDDGDEDIDDDDANDEEDDAEDENDDDDDGNGFRNGLNGSFYSW